MNRFFVDKITPSEICLTGSEGRHLKNVYRASPGMIVEIFDRQGYHCRAEVIECLQQGVRLRPTEDPRQCSSGHHNIFLASALLKSKSWDNLVAKSHGIGVTLSFPGNHQTPGQR